MPFEVLKQEVIGLTDDKMKELIDFARFLKGADRSIFLYKPDNSVKREVGMISEDFISISPDFDTSLEGLEEYI
ncbi:MAG: hypothetical protein IKQ97_09275 [Eubacterium sp.]|nr:hypothetical protein [Eubacterium sp.]